jgi:hypothetical protein
MSSALFWHRTGPENPAEPRAPLLRAVRIVRKIGGNPVAMGEN